MIKHIVVWRLKDFAEGADKFENAKKIQSLFEMLRSKIKEIRFLDVGINLAHSEEAADLVLYVEFEDRKGLAIYQNHPEHLKIVEFLRKVRTERRVIDYQTEEGSKM